MNQYDLRSDTVTKPTDGMRRAMYEAEVGDDVYREDPTTNELEELAASLTGKERALFVSSGSMGNLIPLYINGGRGNEVLCASRSHIVQHEIGSCTAIAGVLPIQIETTNGMLSPADLGGKVKQGDYDMATTTMVEVENTIGGLCYPLEILEGIRDFADTHDLSVHMDGARIFNAQVATGHAVSVQAGYADTLTFCLSKGLGAPVGAMLCGSETFIQRARTIRKMLGGGMRQTGILAAAGLYALHHHVDRLAEDHAHAARIAEILANVPWATIDTDSVHTNMVWFSVPGHTGPSLLQQLQEVGILATAENSQVRLVTHIGIDDTDTDNICNILSDFRPKGATVI